MKYRIGEGDVAIYQILTGLDNNLRIVVTWILII
jgi:hypothetical protein